MEELFTLLAREAKINQLAVEAKKCLRDVFARATSRKHCREGGDS